MSNELDPWSLFIYAMKAPMTRDHYQTRVAKFFEFIGINGTTVEEKATNFVSKAKNDTNWAFNSIKINFYDTTGARSNSVKSKDHEAPLSPVVDTLKYYVTSALDGLIKWYLHLFLPFPQVSWLLNQQWKYSRRFYLLVLVIVEHGYFKDNGNNSPIDTPMKSSNRFFKLSIKDKKRPLLQSTRYSIWM